MPHILSRVDRARVLADLNALRAIRAYKTGVRKPTFSERHTLSLNWLAGQLPTAGLSHHVLENTSDAEIVTGAQVFVETCRRLLTEPALLPLT